MKEIYIDIMEKAVQAYDAQRIRGYVNEVKQNGLKEHGFPRLTANLGILISFGKCTSLYDLMVEMTDICCREIPKKKAANDFSIREIICAIQILSENNAVPIKKTEQWKAMLSEFDPYTGYDVIASSDESKGNWAAFGAASEIMRSRFCQADSSAFIDNQIASLLGDFDQNGMYKDPNNPIMYDYMTRVLLQFILHTGYNGKYKFEIMANLNKASIFSAKMQTVTGEMPFGGRSNQFLFNQTVLAATLEYDAAEYKKKGDMEKAAEYKAAALLAVENLNKWLNDEPVHHIKNRYPTESRIGCEGYGYFNKYMITVASNAYLAYLFADDSIKPTKAPCLQGGYVLQTSHDFHKIILNQSGYYLEIDTNADIFYDANGLGKLQKAGCPSAICLSVPFPGNNAHYKTEKENPQQMSLCSYVQTENGIIYGADTKTKYTDRRFISEHNQITAILTHVFGDKTVTETYTVSEHGANIKIGDEHKMGFMLPIFESDGGTSARITEAPNQIQTAYEGFVCRYTFEACSTSYTYYYNRSGRYRVYQVPVNQIHIEINKE